MLRRGVVWLLRHQLPDGSWPDAHGPVTGGPVTGDLGVTATVLPALLVAGVLPGKPPIRAAVDWLLGQQNLDAGWASGARGGGSEAAATARAVTALLAAGGAEMIDGVDLAADWLVRAQQADGGWSDEPDRSSRGGRRDDAHAGDQASASGRPNGRPSGRSSPRRRGPLVPGLLLPLGALGQYVAAGVADEDENDEATAAGSARVDDPRADGSRMADRLPAE